MSYSKYIKDVRVKTGEFYIAKRISESNYKVIYKKGAWFFPRNNDKKVSISWIKESNDGTYKYEEISEQDVFLEML